MAVIDGERAIVVKGQVDVVMSLRIVVVFAEHVDVDSAIGVDVNVLNASFEDAVVVAHLFAFKHCAKLLLDAPVCASV